MNMERKVIIAGGTGSVGEGLVKYFLAQNWLVIVPGRREASLEQLKAFCNHDANLHTYVTEISKPAEAAAFFAECGNTYGNVDLLIASLGGWRQHVDLLHLSWDDWQATIADNMSSHFLAIKYGFPLLNEGGTYVHINGMGAEAVIPHAGPTVAAAAAQMKLALTLAEEQKHSGKKVYELVLGVVNTRVRNIKGDKGDQLINPELVARYIEFLISGESGLGETVLHKLNDAASVKSHIEK
jgi:NAD(P)-dependent dehydrogenase (short-subunit alcohol dehydrogenase family)